MINTREYYYAVVTEDFLSGAPYDPCAAASELDTANCTDPVTLGILQIMQQNALKLYIRLDQKAVSTSIQTISSPITPMSSLSPQIPTPPTRFLYGGMQPSGATAAVLQAVGFAPRMRRQILWHATLRVYFTMHLLGQCTDIQFSIVSACLSLRAANCSLVSGLWWLCWSATPSNC